jgi:hypothetical protein
MSQEESLSRQLTRDFHALHSDNDDDDDDDSSVVPKQPEGNKASHDNCFQFTRCVRDMVRTKQSRQSILKSSEQQKQLKRAINHDFSEMLLDQSSVSGKASSVHLHLLAMGHVVEEFFALAQTCKHVQTSKNKDNTIQRKIFKVLEQYILPRIAIHYDSRMDQISKEDTVRIIAFMDKFLNYMADFCPLIVVDESWKLDLDRLLNHYSAKSVRPVMQSLLERALHMQSRDDAVQICTDSDGHITTSYLGTAVVAQVDSMYNHQLSVARNLLPPTASYQEGVLVACNQQFARSVCDLQLKISADYKAIGIRNFCAIINDALCLSRQCEQRNRVVLTRLQFQQEGKALIGDLSDLALHATKYLCARILLDLRNPQVAAMTSAGGDHEESSRPETITSLIPMKQAVTMLKRWFETIETWLLDPSVYIPKLMKNVFDEMLQTYIESFFANTLARGIKNADTAAQEIRQDYLCLVIFFNGVCCEKYHAGKSHGDEFYTQFAINERLLILQNVAAILDPTKPPTGEEIKGVLSNFASGENGPAVILHIAGLRKQQCSNAESLTWIKAIAIAKKEMAQQLAKKQGKKHDDDSGNDDDDEEEDDINNDKDSGTSTSSSVDAAAMDLHVPDLRNSKYLLKIRPPKYTQRELSVGTRPFAESTLRLLQGR